MYSLKNTLILVITSLILLPQYGYSQNTFVLGVGINGDLYSYYHTLPVPFPSLALDIGYSINEKNAIYGLVRQSFFFNDFNKSRGAGIRYERCILTHKQNWSFNATIDSRLHWGQFIYNTISWFYEVPLYNQKAVVTTLGFSAEKHLKKRNSVLLNIGCGYFYSFQPQPPDIFFNNSPLMILHPDKDKRLLLNFTITYRKAFSL